MPKVAKKVQKKESSSTTDIAKKQEVKNIKEKTKKRYFYAVGRRKSAKAQVRLYSGKGEIIINEKEYKEYFSTFLLQKIIIQPLSLVGNIKKFDIEVKTEGGGKRGQAEAVRLGIARALLNSDKDLKKTLKKAGYLSRDSRVKERKKYGCRGARRGRQFRKR